MERPGQPSPARASRPSSPHTPHIPSTSCARPAASASGSLGSFRNGYCSHSSHFLLCSSSFPATFIRKSILQYSNFLSNVSHQFPFILTLKHHQITLVHYLNTPLNHHFLMIPIHFSAFFLNCSYPLNHQLNIQISIFMFQA